MNHQKLRAETCLLSHSSRTFPKATEKCVSSLANSISIGKGEESSFGIKANKKHSSDPAASKCHNILRPSGVQTNNLSRLIAERSFFANFVQLSLSQHFHAPSN
jgi:hypothetical protein